MTVLRIHADLTAPTLPCDWSIVGNAAASGGSSELAALTGKADLVQLVFPAAQVLITQTRLPESARSDRRSVLAYAVEEKTTGDPEANTVIWLGMSGDNDVLVVIDKPSLAQWREALAAAGVHHYEIHSEMLLLPLQPGEWSLAWNGREGFVRTSRLEAGTTDCGDEQQPPLALHLMLATARANHVAPAAIAVYPVGKQDTALAEDSRAGAIIDTAAWTQALGIPVRLAGHWHWSTAPVSAGIPFAREKKYWQGWSDIGKRLRPAAAMLALALLIHAVALLTGNLSLAMEKKALYRQMEQRFRSTFPDAVAVADPALQMRRKLAEARASVGQADNGDFLPMLDAVATTVTLPENALRSVSYDSGQLTLALSGMDPVQLNQLITQLRDAGMNAEGESGDADANNNSATLTVRAL